MTIYDVRAKFHPIPADDPDNAAQIAFLVHFAQSQSVPETFELVNQETGEVTEVRSEKFTSPFPVWDFDSIASALRSPANFMIEDLFDSDGMVVALGRVSQGVIRVGDAMRVSGDTQTEELTVKRIQLFGRDCEIAYLGENAGLYFASQDRAFITTGNLLVGDTVA